MDPSRPWFPPRPRSMGNRSRKPRNFSRPPKGRSRKRWKPLKGARAYEPSPGMNPKRTTHFTAWFFLSLSLGALLQFEDDGDGIGYPNGPAPLPAGPHAGQFGEDAGRFGLQAFMGPAHPDLGDVPVLRDGEHHVDLAFQAHFLGQFGISKMFLDVAL